MTESFEQKVFETIERNNMGISGRDALVCVSGGPDSMALLFFAVKNSEKLGIGHVRACHFNHGLRGAESDSEERMVSDYCRKLNVELAVGYGKMRENEAPKGKSEEMWARDLRYEFFNVEAARSDSLLWIAHNLNDSIETMLFHIARGTGLRGTRGIEPVYRNIRRPFIDIERDMILEYCRENGIPYSIDSSNLNSDYSRNRIRLAVIPEFEKINPGFIANAARYLRHMDDVYGYLESKVLGVLHDAVNGDDGDSFGKDVLNRADEYIRRMALKRILDDRFDSITERDVSLMCELLEGKINAFQINGAYRIESDDRFIHIREYTPREETGSEIPTEIAVDDLDADYVFEGCPVTFELIECDSAYCLKNIYNICIDYDKIEFKLTIRGRRSGDTFTSAVRHNTKTLKKLFTELKLDEDQRRKMPLICDEKGVLWIPGQGPAARAAVTDRTKRALVIRTGENGTNDA